MSEVNSRSEEGAGALKSFFPLCILYIGEYNDGDNVGALREAPLQYSLLIAT
jgi:hypothetical protein